MTLTYSLNGLDLHDPGNGRKLLDATSWSNNIAMRNTVLSLPGMHGAVPVWAAPLDSSNLVLRVQVKDRDEDGLNDKWNLIMRHLGVGNNRGTLIERARSAAGADNGRQVSAYGQLVSADQPDFSCAGGLVTSSLIFSIPGGRWYGAAETEVLSLTGANQAVTIAQDSTMPITESQFLVKGPIAGLHIFDNVSQTGFDWTGVNITSAQWLLIDLATFTAWQKSSAAYDLSGTNVSAGLANSGVGWLSLVPGIADGITASSVSVTSSGTSGASTLTLRAQPAYQ